MYLYLALEMASPGNQHVPIVSAHFRSLMSNVRFTPPTPTRRNKTALSCSVRLHELGMAPIMSHARHLHLLADNLDRLPQWTPSAPIGIILKLDTR